MTHSDAKTLTRRSLAAALTAAGTSARLLAQQVAPAPPVPKHTGPPPETPAFGETIDFTRKDAPLKVRAFAMTDVRLLPGPFQQAQEANLGYLRRLDADRLLHNFRINAGLRSSAQPLATRSDRS